MDCILLHCYSVLSRCSVLPSSVSVSSNELPKKHSVFLLLLSFFQLKEAKQLVQDAIAAGIFCDLGSGSNVDLCVITEAGVEYLRGYDKPTTKGKR